MVAPRNAPNTREAFRCLNALLAPPAQQAFAAKEAYTAAVDDAPLTGRIARQSAVPDPPPKLLAPEYSYTTRVQDQVGTWWNKLILRG